MSATVVTLGEAMLRLSTQGSGRLEEAGALDVRPGGAEVNVAVALASLGVSAAWIGALPQTPLGRRVASAVAAAGVDVSHVVWRPEGRVGLYFVEFGAPPRPTTVWYDRAGSAFTELETFDESALEGARFALISGITPALGPASRRLTARFADATRDAGAGLCVDVNHRTRLWNDDAARDALAPLLARAEVVVCSRADAASVLGCAGDDDEAVARELHERWAHAAEVVAVTLSDRGAVAVGADGRLVVQPGYETTVVDRFGAGDAFTAGLLWGLLEGDLDAAVRAGAALGALKCTVPGDFARFTADEVRAVDARGNALLR